MKITTREKDFKVLEEYLEILRKIQLTNADLQTAIHEGPKSRPIAHHKRNIIDKLEMSAEDIRKKTLKNLFNEYRQYIELNNNEEMFPKTMRYVFLEGAESAYSKFKEVLEEIKSNEKAEQKFFTC